MSYSDTLATDKDWVRFLSGDTDVSDERLSDNEIAGILLAETAPNAEVRLV